MKNTLELLVERAGGRLRLVSPEVGLFADALPEGSVLVPGQHAGTLETLGRVRDLRVPDAGGGRVVSAPPRLARAPVGHGEVLYELDPLAAGSPLDTTALRTDGSVAGADRTGALVLHAPQAGRFYHRPAPGEPPFVAAGAVVEDGQPVGMLEVMKTFSHVPYRATGGLPSRARVVRVLAADGADVRQGDPVLEVEPA